MSSISAVMLNAVTKAMMDSAEQLGASFGLDVTKEDFWTASLDVLRARVRDYEQLAAPHLKG